MKKIIFAVLILMGNFAFAISQKDVVAATLWHEARGEGKVGIDAVASVIYNRSAKSGRTLQGECLRPKQFSCWNGKVPSVPANAKGKVWDYCQKVAKSLCDGSFVPTVSATHYYNPKLCNPSWARVMKNSTVIGNHRFGEC